MGLSIRCLAEEIEREKPVGTHGLFLCSVAFLDATFIASPLVRTVGVG